MDDMREICCLCGKPATQDDHITREHAPPKQFYPKSMRDGLNLWMVPTHRSCNNAHKADEEYFYHALYPLVANSNSEMAQVIFDDLKRRAKKPQTQRLLRSILNTKQGTTGSGIILPPGIVRLDIDAYRVQRAAIKIARCLFYRDHAQYMPYENCKDIRLCECEDDVPEMYQLSWEMSKVNVHELTPRTPGGIVVTSADDGGQPEAECQKVFNYRSAHIEELNLHLYTLMFWEAFVFCMAFDDPKSQATAPYF